MIARSTGWGLIATVATVMAWEMALFALVAFRLRLEQGANGPAREERKRRQDLLLVLAVSPCLMTCGLCVFLSTAMREIAYPTTYTLATRYLYAIANNDNEAIKLLGPEVSSGLGELIDIRAVRVENYDEDVQSDLATWGGVQIRNIRLEVRGGGSDNDRWQWALVDFDYRKVDQAEWLHGTMRIDTDVTRGKVPARRFVLGHGP